MKETTMKLIPEWIAVVKIIKSTGKNNETVDYRIFAMFNTGRAIHKLYLILREAIPNELLNKLS